MLEINGKQYISAAQASVDLNVSQDVIYKALKNGITTIQGKEKINPRRGKQVIINGKTYRSIREAARDLNYSTSAISRRIIDGINTIEPLECRRFGVCNGRERKVTDCEGNIYKSCYDMDRAHGLSLGTTRTRISRGYKLTPFRQKACRKGVVRHDVYYQGILYHGLINAKKLLHHDEGWIKKNCHLIPVYQDRWERMDIDGRLWYDIKNIMYRPMQWNEDRIIAECDRRLKKLFAHGKLIKHKADAQ